MEIYAFLEGLMVYDVENVVENIDFSMKMEDMPLTDEDKNRLRNCLMGRLMLIKFYRKLLKSIHWRKHKRGKI
jgi:hypothetical protein